MSQTLETRCFDASMLVAGPAAPPPAAAVVVSPRLASPLMPVAALNTQMSWVVQDALFGDMQLRLDPAAAEPAADGADLLHHSTEYSIPSSVWQQLGSTSITTATTAAALQGQPQAADHSQQASLRDAASPAPNTPFMAANVVLPSASSLPAADSLQLPAADDQLGTLTTLLQRHEQLRLQEGLLCQNRQHEQQQQQQQLAQATVMEQEPSRSAANQHADEQHITENATATAGAAQPGLLASPEAPLLRHTSSLKLQPPGQLTSLLCRRPARATPCTPARNNPTRLPPLSPGRHVLHGAGAAVTYRSPRLAAGAPEPLTLLNQHHLAAPAATRAMAGLAHFELQLSPPALLPQRVRHPADEDAADADTEDVLLDACALPGVHITSPFPGRITGLMLPGQAGAAEDSKAGDPNLHSHTAACRLPDASMMGSSGALASAAVAGVPLSTNSPLAAAVYRNLQAQLLPDLDINQSQLPCSVGCSTWDSANHLLGSLPWFSYGADALQSSVPGQLLSPGGEVDGCDLLQTSPLPNKQPYRRWLSSAGAAGSVQNSRHRPARRAATGAGRRPKKCKLAADLVAGDSQPEAMAAGSAEIVAASEAAGGVAQGGNGLRTRRSRRLFDRDHDSQWPFPNRHQQGFAADVASLLGSPVGPRRATSQPGLGLSQTHPSMAAAADSSVAPQQNSRRRRQPAANAGAADAGGCASPDPAAAAGGTPVADKWLVTVPTAFSPHKILWNSSSCHLATTGALASGPVAASDAAAAADGLTATFQPSAAAAADSLQGPGSTSAHQAAAELQQEPPAAPTAAAGTQLLQAAEGASPGNRGSDPITTAAAAAAEAGKQGSSDIDMEEAGAAGDGLQAMQSAAVDTAGTSGATAATAKLQATTKSGKAATRSKAANPAAPPRATYPLLSKMHASADAATAALGDTTAQQTACAAEPRSQRSRHPKRHPAAEEAFQTYFTDELDGSIRPWPRRAAAINTNTKLKQQLQGRASTTAPRTTAAPGPASSKKRTATADKPIKGSQARSKNVQDRAGMAAAPAAADVAAGGNSTAGLAAAGRAPPAAAASAPTPAAGAATTTAPAAPAAIPAAVATAAAGAKPPKVNKELAALMDALTMLVDSNGDEPPKEAAAGGSAAAGAAGSGLARRTRGADSADNAAAPAAVDPAPAAAATAGAPAAGQGPAQENAVQSTAAAPKAAKRRPPVQPAEASRPAKRSRAAAAEAPPAAPAAVAKEAAAARKPLTSSKAAGNRPDRAGSAAAAADNAAARDVKQLRKAGGGGVGSSTAAAAAPAAAAATGGAKGTATAAKRAAAAAPRAASQKRAAAADNPCKRGPSRDKAEPESDEETATDSDSNYSGAASYRASSGSEADSDFSGGKPSKRQKQRGGSSGGSKRGKQAGPRSAAASAPTGAAHAAAAVAEAAARDRSKGGRPLGAGNKQQMQPTGRRAFCSRSMIYTGVYRGQRGGHWRAQFCWGGKVLTIGSYPSEEEAARAWNAAAVHFRGAGTWMNPVEPQLPEDGGVVIQEAMAARGYPAA